MTAKAILKQALKLNEKERKMIYRQLEKTFDSQWLDPDMPDWHKRELEQSIREQRENPNDYITWEELKKKMTRRRLKK